MADSSQRPPESAPSETKGQRKPRKSAIATIAHALRDFWRAFPDFLYYDVLYRFLAIVLVVPLLVWLFGIFIARSGSEAIGNFDIAIFLLTPAGASMACLILLLVLTIACARYAGLILIGYGAAEGRRVNYLDALEIAFWRRFPRVLGVSFLVLFILVLVALPFVLAILFTAARLITEHDINYYLSTKPPEFVRAVCIGGAIALAGAVVLLLAGVPLLFALPHALFTDLSIPTLFQESRRLARGQFWGIASTILLWLAIVSVVSMAAHAVVFVVGALLVGAAGARIGPLVAALGSFATMNFLLNLAIDFTGMSIFCVVVARLYRQARERLALGTPALLQVTAPLGLKPNWTLHKKAPLAVAVLAILVAGLVAHQVLQNVDVEDRVDIAAHRGASLAAPENTLSAVRRAIADGADFVEFDVQLTADGEIVVNHDADLMRVAGSPLVISETPFGELREVDVGTPFGAKFAGEGLPTLGEVIDAADGQVKLIVELKSYRADADKLVTKVVKTIRDCDLVEDAVVMSLKYDEVLNVERLAPEIVSGFVASASLGSISKLTADFLAVSQAQATDAFITTAHAHGKEVYVWTVDDPDDMSTMIDRGVDNIITNDPATAVRVLHDRAELGTAERILLRFRSLYVH